MTGAHAGGRPINEAATPAILDAARALVSEHGYSGVSLDMIAKAAGVGRQTVYRRWRTKADLILDAFLVRAESLSTIADGPVRTMLTLFLTQIFEGLTVDGIAVRNVIASAQGDEAFRRYFYEQFVEPRNQIVREIVQKGIDAGELHAKSNAAFISEIVHGAYWYRLLLDLPLDARYAHQLATFALQDGLKDAL